MPCLVDASFVGDEILHADELVASDVTAETRADCAHFVPEKRPDAVIRHIQGLAAKISSNC